MRNADAEAPAGGLSTSVDDMTQFLRLQLGHGTVDGTEIVDAAALQVTHVPHQDLSQPTTPGVRTQFYGLVLERHRRRRGPRTPRPFRRLRPRRSDERDAHRYGGAGHRHADQRPAARHPGGDQQRLLRRRPERRSDGRLARLLRRRVRGTVRGLDDQQGEQWRAPPAAPAPAAAETAYVGTYQNPYYGPLTVTFDGGALNMSMGPPASPTNFVLAHFDGDTFTYDTIGENAHRQVGRRVHHGRRRDGDQRQPAVLRHDGARHVHPRLSADPSPSWARIPTTAGRIGAQKWIWRRWRPENNDAMSARRPTRAAGRAGCAVRSPARRARCAAPCRPGCRAGSVGRRRR